MDLAEARTRFGTPEPELEPGPEPPATKPLRTSATPDPVRGRSFVFTGRMSRPRAEILARVSRLGGLCHRSVTNSLDFLVVADPDEKPTAKVKKARQLLVPTINEDQFLVMLDEAERAQE
jgi:DNA ligase (NAD+)